MTHDGNALLEIIPAEAAARGGSGGGATGDEAAYQLCALVRVERALSPHVVGARLLARCWRISARIEQIRTGAPDAPDALVGVFLDMGRCSADEAQAIAMRLAAWLRQHEWRSAIGIGPTLVSAELAALTALADMASDTCAARLVTPARLAAWMRDAPVTRLARLDPLRALPLEVVARLQRSGLWTLGHVTRLDARDPQVLRRQYGVVGARLAALCRGEDIRPLQPERRAPQVTRRWFFAPAATADEARATLPALVGALVRRLQQRDKQSGSLRLRIEWASGAVTHARRRLGRPLGQPAELTEAVERLFDVLLPPPRTASAVPPPLVTALTVTLGDLSLRLAAQPVALLPLASAQPERSVAQERIARLAVEVAEPLTRRYGAPALYRLDAHQPDAILPEERLRLVSLKSADATDTHAKQAPGSRRAQRARVTDQALDLSRATPPQPHWW